jgi:hypothetical protein
MELVGRRPNSKRTSHGWRNTFRLAGPDLVVPERGDARYLCYTAEADRPSLRGRTHPNAIAATAS